MTSPFDPNLAPNYPQGPRTVVYLEASRDPFIAPDTNLTSKDTKYRDGSFYKPNTEWRNTSVSPPRIWKLAAIVNKTTAQWQLIGGSSGAVTSLRGDDGAIATPNLGIIDVLGAVVANSANPKAVYTDNTSIPSTSLVEVQVASAIAASDITKVGLAAFNSGQFTVGSDGFVSLAGGGLAIDQILVQATSGTGTNPVLPTSAGQVAIAATIVAQVGVPAITTSTLPNSFITQIQTTAANSTSDITKNGLSHFSDTYFNVDANGFVQPKNAFAMAGVSNIGFSYNAGTGTFTVQGQNGTALSAANPGYVTLQSKAVPGQLMTIAVTANQDFIDDNGASQIIGNLFGLTSAVATTGVDLPFFLYAVSNDAENAIAFMISRFPNAPFSPVSAKIGMPSTVAASTQGSFFSLENITATDYDQNPCVAIGSFRMTMSAADDWTVQTITAFEGIGKFYGGFQFAFPRGQFGAATGKIFKNNGGTAPDDADGGYTYYIDQRNSRIFFQLAFPALDTAGVGAVTAQLALPFIRADGATVGGGYLNVGAAYSMLMPFTIPSTNTVQIPAVNDTATGLATNAAFGLGAAVSMNGTFSAEYT